MDLRTLTERSLHAACELAVPHIAAKWRGAVRDREAEGKGQKGVQFVARMGRCEGEGGGRREILRSAERRRCGARATVA
eukprot:5833020-Prymnesium_polylepis.3